MVISLDKSFKSSYPFPQSNKLSRLIINNDKMSALMHVINEPTDINIKHYERNCLQWKHNPTQLYSQLCDNRAPFSMTMAWFLRTNFELYYLVAYLSTCGVGSLQRLLDEKGIKIIDMVNNDQAAIILFLTYRMEPRYKHLILYHVHDCMLKRYFMAYLEFNGIFPSNSYEERLALMKCYTMNPYLRINGNFLIYRGMLFNNSDDEKALGLLLPHLDDESIQVITDILLNYHDDHLGEAHIKQLKALYMFNVSGK